MNFEEVLVASRRLFVLRQIVECDGEIVESTLYKLACRRFHGQTTRESVRRDLDHLQGQHCVTENWDGNICRVAITERGEDAAFGKIDVVGVERSRWER